VVNPRKRIKLGVTDPAGIARVTLVRAGSVTHSYDMSQQFIELPFQRKRHEVRAELPDNAALTPPGTYLAFVVDAAGVPSVAKLVRINPSDRAGNGAATALSDDEAGSDAALEGEDQD
jgi:hypothetical protein